MCGRYALSADIGELAENFAIDGLARDDGEILQIAEGVRNTPSWLAPRYNIAPTQTVAAVLSPAPGSGVQDPGSQAAGEAGGRVLVGLRWGLVPSWARGLGGRAVINARLGTADGKPYFRAAVARRRCLLPADGYYEWYASKQDGRTTKIPNFIHRADHSPMAMAGLFEFWRTPAGEWLSSCAILTTRAADNLGHVHDRMPVQVAPENWTPWLDRDLTDGHAALEMVHIPADEEMTAYRVSSAVNRVANDSAELLEPLTDNQEGNKGG